MGRVKKEQERRHVDQRLPDVDINMHDNLPLSPFLTSKAHDTRAIYFQPSTVFFSGSVGLLIEKGSWGAWASLTRIWNVAKGMVGLCGYRGILGKMV